MCRRGRQLLLWLVLFVTAGFDPMLGLDEEKPNRVGRDTHTSMPSIISSTSDLFCAAGIFILTLSDIILLSFKKKNSSCSHLQSSKKYINWQGISFTSYTGNKPRSPKSDLLNKMSVYDSLTRTEFTSAERGRSKSCPSFPPAGCTSSFYLVLALPFTESKYESQR